MEDLIQNFGIDWKLFAAQVVNFFILFFLLKRFAYKPVFGMLKKRREGIEKGIQFEREAEDKLGRVDSDREEILGEANKKALDTVNKAEVRAGEREEEIMKDAAIKSEYIVGEGKRIIREGRAKMDEEVYKDAKDIVRESVRKVLIKMPGGAKDQELITQALREVKAIRK